MDKAAAAFGIEPGRNPQTQPDRTFSLHLGHRPGVRRRQLSRDAGHGGRAYRSAELSRAAARGARARPLSRHWLCDLLRAHRLRQSGFRGARHGDHAGLGTRRDRDGPVRPRRSPHRREPARPGAAQRRWRSSSPTRSASRRTTCAWCTATPTARPMAGARSPAARWSLPAARHCWRREKSARSFCIAGEPSCWRPRATTSCSKTAAPKSPGPTAPCRSRRWRAPPIIRPTASRARSARACARAPTTIRPAPFPTPVMSRSSRSMSKPARVSLEKFLAVEDAGRIINPLIADGQVHGGIAQGIGNALFEEIVYDADGNIPTATLADYLPPTAREIPPIEIAPHRDADRRFDHRRQGPGRRRRYRRAGGDAQRRQRCAVAVRRLDRRNSGDAAAYPGGAAASG